MAGDAPAPSDTGAVPDSPTADVPDDTPHRQPAPELLSDSDERPDASSPPASKRQKSGEKKRRRRRKKTRKADVAQPLSDASSSLPSPGGHDNAGATPATVAAPAPLAAQALGAVAEPPPGPTAKGPTYGAMTKGTGTAVPLEVLSSPATWPLMEEEAGTTRNPPKGEDYTANLRTMLAWWRTSMGLAIIGVALGRLLHEDAGAVGLVFVCLAFVFGVLSTVRYGHTLGYLKRGHVSVNRWMIMCTTGSTLVGMALLVYFSTVSLDPPV